MNFRVTGTLELFENYIIHAATRIDQRRSDNRERSALFNVASRTEESLWTL